jgi:PAS domain S-box-containing protein
MLSGLDVDSVYRSLFAAYPDALLLVDEKGAIALANPAAAELFGYSTDELAALTVDALVPDAVRARHADYRGAYARNPRARPMGTQMELVARRRDGSEVMVEIALSPLKDLGLPLVVAAVRGIGAYPRVRQALQRARYSECVADVGRLAVDTRDPQRLLRHVPEAAARTLEADMAVLYRLEPNGLELRVAAGFAQLDSESEGTLVPNRPDTPPGAAIAQGRPMIVEDYRQEPRFVVPPAYVEHGLVSAIAVPLSDRGRPVGVLAVHSRRAQRFGDDEIHFLQSLSNLLTSSLQRAETEEVLNHAQRLETVGQLTGGIAHDFNNLLTVIQGNLQVLEELPALHDDHAAQLVAAAARASKRGAELTGKLLAFSRRQVLQPTRVDVGALLHSLADMLRRTLDQRIRIAVEVTGSCPPVLADPGQLESALLNIAINARDAMPDGGLLAFRAEATARGAVAIAITDSGGGMSEEVRERAFEPFFTTKEKGRGTGLGLSTVYGFVKQSNGAIELDSEPGRGTTVTLHIPLWRDAAGEAAADGPAAVTLPPRLRVLLVEDDAEVRKVVGAFLAALGCDVTTHGAAEQALAVLQQGARFDVLLSDVALGTGMRGTELARCAQQHDARLAVLLMSGYAPELLEPGRSEPLRWELLRKPYTRDELARALARALPARPPGEGVSAPARPTNCAG